MVIPLSGSTAKPVWAFATTDTVAAQKAARTSVRIPSNLVPNINGAVTGNKCIPVTIPVITNEKAVQNTPHRALVETSPSSERFCA